MEDPPDLDAAVGVGVSAAPRGDQFAVAGGAERPEGGVGVVGVAEQVADGSGDLAEQGRGLLVVGDIGRRQFGIQTAATVVTRWSFQP
jgi:hypothetical protein